jgi:hypothetical protein
MTTPCAGDPRFTSDDPFDRAEAAEVCGGCPIADACLAGARARGEQWHVWGGRDFGAVELAEPAAYVRPVVCEPVHSRTHYIAGCRTPECLAANARYMAAWRAEHRYAPHIEREPMPEQLAMSFASPVTTTGRVNA